MAGILALIAPRALKICNALKDTNSTFYPAEMLRSFVAARPVYQVLGADERLTYQVFNLPHGYWTEVREAMYGWFDRWLKGVGDGSPRPETGFRAVPAEQLMCFRKGKRPPIVPSIAEFCRKRGEELIAAARAKKSMNPAGQAQRAAPGLAHGDALILKDVRDLGRSESTGGHGGEWWSPPRAGSIRASAHRPGGCEGGLHHHPQGGRETGTPDPALVEQALARGQGVLLLYGRRASATWSTIPRFTTTRPARTCGWAGRSWANAPAGWN